MNIVYQVQDIIPLLFRIHLVIIIFVTTSIVIFNVSNGRWKQAEYVLTYDSSTFITKIKFSNFNIITIFIATRIRTIIIVVFCIFIILMEFVNETGVATYKKIDKNLF